MVKAFLLAAAMAVLLAIPVTAGAAGKPVTLVYRLESERQSIVRVLSACGYAVTAIPETGYKTDSLLGCTALVTTVRQPYLDSLSFGIPVLCVGPQAGPVDGIKTQSVPSFGGMLHAGNIQASINIANPSLLISEYEGEAAGEMEFPLRGKFPYGVIQNSVAYVPHYVQDDLQPLALGLVAKKLFGDAENGRLFLLIDEVYPFSDLGMLCHMADELYKRGYPFTVSAMPVYDNLDYPSFLRYAQVLRYMESRGGAILMHDPIIRAAETEQESPDARLARARSALEEQGLHLANGFVSPYPLSLNGFSNLSGAVDPFGPLPMDVSITLPIAKTPEEFDHTLEVIRRKWITAASLQKMVTGEPVLYNEEPIGSDYAYREEIQTSFEGFFTAGNRTLIVIVVISLVVFSGLLTGGYFLYRRKFYR